MGTVRATVTVPGHLLNVGDYTVRVVVLRDTSLSDYLLDVEEAIRFTVIEDRRRAEVLWRT